MALPVWAAQALGTLFNIGLQAGGQYLSNKFNQWANQIGGSPELLQGTSWGASHKAGPAVRQ